MRTNPVDRTARYGRKATIQQLKQEVQQFCEERDWNQFHNPKDLAIGISTEANELLAEFRFKTTAQLAQMQGAEASDAVRQELADVLFFVLRFAQMNGIDLADALSEKIALNEQKYPVDLVHGQNKKYTEY